MVLRASVTVGDDKPSDRRPGEKDPAEGSSFRQRETGGSSECLDFPGISVKGSEQSWGTWDIRAEAEPGMKVAGGKTKM